MVIGENSRADDLDVNITKAKQMTNVRSNADVLVRLNPPHTMSLDQAIEYIQEGECIEVTPKNIRLRKAILGRLGAQQPALQGRPRARRVAAATPRMGDAELPHKCRDIGYGTGVSCSRG